MPAGITIVGLGPGHRQQWTEAARQALTTAAELYLRTAHHPGVDQILAKSHSFDDLFEQTENFDQVGQQIAAKIVTLGQRSEGVVYAVPGHPALGEATTPLIRAKAQAQKLPVTIIPGASVLEPALTALEMPDVSNLQISDALQIAARYHPPLEPDRTALITNLHGQAMARRVKASLLNAYPAAFEVTLLQAPGGNEQRVWRCPLAELDQQPRPEALTTLYLPAGQLSGFSSFQETVAHLRAPDGCPWDREQTHRSLRPYLLEETYEVLEALDAEDTDALAEELGDLLLQVVLHTQVAIDQGEFKMGAVIDHINRKLLRRHPHVFGDIDVDGIPEVMANWEAIKKAEKAAKGITAPSASALDGVPPGLPALAQALAISKRAVRVGFEWPNIEGVLDKIIEEAHEVAEATEPDHLESEIGDLLFSVVNLARWRGIDPESALRATNARFGRRFRQIEALAAAQGKTLPELSLGEMDVLWDLAKQKENSHG